MMNMINHANIYLKKQSAEYARIILSTWHKVTEFTEQLPRQNAVKHLRLSILQKE